MVVSCSSRVAVGVAALALALRSAWQARSGLTRTAVSTRSHARPTRGRSNSCTYCNLVAIRAFDCLRYKFVYAESAAFRTLHRNSYIIYGARVPEVSGGAVPVETDWWGAEGVSCVRVQ